MNDLAPEQQAFLSRRYSTFKRLLADPDFVAVILNGELLRLREDTIREQRGLRGVDLERSAACVEMLDDLRAHMDRVVADYEQMLSAQAERQERLAKGLPVDDD